MGHIIDFQDPDWEQKYNASFDEDDDYDEGPKRSTKSQLWIPRHYDENQFQEVAQKRVATEIRDTVKEELYSGKPKIIIQQSYQDQRTGMSIPIGSVLAEGGAELLNDPAIAPYIPSKNAGLSHLEQMPIENWDSNEILQQQQHYPPPYPQQQQLPPALSALINSQQQQQQLLHPQQQQMQQQQIPQQQIPQQQTPVQTIIDYQTSRRPQQQNVAPARSNYDNLLRELGFDFISIIPSPPTLQVKICFSGSVRFNIPLMCHKIIVTDQMVVIVIDNRQQNTIDMDFGIENANVRTDILMPDMRKIPVVTMITGDLSFDLGPLRCFLFFRKEDASDQESPRNADYANKENTGI
jgi:hypothetical protein